MPASSTSLTRSIYSIAVFAPLPGSFDYTIDNETVPIGARVQVPFGRSQRIGVVLAKNDPDKEYSHSIKPVLAVIDDESLIPADLLTLSQRIANYYHHPIGEVLATALPNRLKAGQLAQLSVQSGWQLTPSGQALSESDLARAPQQVAGWLTLQQAPQYPPFTAQQRAAFKRLQANGYIETVTQTDRPPLNTATRAVELNPAQQAVVEHCRERTAFNVQVLQGVTGSGKTEVYLALMQQQLQQGKQALLLVPEINLTPQLLDRVQDRLQARIVLLHSGLTDTERTQAWLLARAGLIDVVIGTRSAIFTPLAKPGLIIVDEEHDASFKQQDGLRYSARDVAVLRGQINNHQVLLGSATPALETLHNVQHGRYEVVVLNERAGNAKPARLRLVDMQREGSKEGLTPSAVGAMEAHLAAGQQVLVFLNRRGYAPLLLCNACGWQGDCPHCSAHLTLHQRQKKLTCHHCGFETRPPQHCPDCHSIDLGDVGQGTERLEQVCQERFPEYLTLRMDSDTIRSKSGLANSRNKVLSGEAKILIGTQILAKGHHFPDVTLVVMVDIDGMLKSPDPKALEQTAQMIVQVAGRAGRGDKPGEVLLQTRYPEHPLLKTLLYQGYPAFAQQELQARQAAGMPPHTRMALLRAEAVYKADAMTFLQDAKRALPAQWQSVLQLMGPATALMERRANRYRVQLMITAQQRGPMQQALAAWLPAIRQLKLAKKVRWSLDVDPMDCR